MKKNYLAKKLTAALLTSAMVLSMGGMTAFADEPQNVTITKELSKNQYFYQPQGSYSFTITPGTEQTGVKGNDNKPLQSPAAGATFANGAGTITASPSNADIGEATVTVGTTDITVAKTGVFTEPGIYRYEVRENNTNIKGVGYSEEVKYFDVYVDKDLNVYAYTFVSATNSKEKDDGKFVNTYDEESGVHSLTVTKVVTGNQGNTSKPFSFTIKVDGEANELYHVSYGNGKEITLVSGTAQTIELAHNESAVITGLDEDDEYTITEANYGGEEYSTKITKADGSEVEYKKDDERARTVTGTINDNKTITYTNDKTVSSPTGIAMTFAPYALMVVFAGGLAVLFLRKKKEDF